MPNFSVEELPIPTVPGAAGWDDFVGMVEVRNAIELDTTGNVSSYTAEDLLPTWQDEYEPKTLLVARRDGRIIGRGTYDFGVEPGDPVAWLAVQVVPDERHRGVGSALFDRMVELAVAQGRAVLQGNSATQANLPGGTIESPTGFGSVPLADPGVRFALARGFRLAQVSRESRLELDGFDAASRLVAALEETGPDYRVISWTGHTPEKYRDDLAMLHNRLRTDSPRGELDIDGPDWDAERIRAEDELHNSGSRSTFLVVAEHIPSGRLVGYNDLWVPADPSVEVTQQDTLVTSDHRGHRLGMLLKLAGIAQLQELAPGHPAIITFNAEENRPMLDVNEALGFEPISYAGVWKRSL
jgi:GNAT superfamily N-acetyltransferase